MSSINQLVNKIEPADSGLLKTKIHQASLRLLSYKRFLFEQARNVIQFSKRSWKCWEIVIQVACKKVSSNLA